MVEIGKRYRVKVADSSTRDKGWAWVTGKCIFINQRGRFALMELPGGGRECFFLEDIRE